MKRPHGARHATLRLIVDVAALGEAMRELVPPYRAQHVAANLRALEAGAGTVLAA